MDRRTKKFPIDSRSRICKVLNSSNSYGFYMSITFFHKFGVLMYSIFSNSPEKINMSCVRSHFILASWSVKTRYDRRTVFELCTGVRFLYRFGSVICRVLINKYYHFKLLCQETCDNNVMAFLLTAVFHVSTLRQSWIRLAGCFCHISGDV